MAVLTFTKNGTKATTAAKLDASVFGALPKSHELLKSAYVGYLAQGRTSAGNTKTRGEVSGGGRKPWKQKGTGRARFGSSRVPIWRGGGITFGPTGNENYAHKMNSTAKRQAIRQALSVASQENSLIIIESFECKDGKTSYAASLLEKIGAKGNILLAVSSKDDDAKRATANLKSLKMVQASYLNVYDLLNADTIVMTKDGLEAVHAWLKPSASPSKKEAK